MADPETTRKRTLCHVSTPKTKPTRQRVCAECGRIETVRKDSQSLRCKSCAAKPNHAAMMVIVSGRRLTVQCGHCARIFFTTPSKREHGNRFCSMACRRLGQSVERECRWCKKKFRMAKSLLGGNTNASGNFCSRLCYADSMAGPGIEQARGSRWKATRTEAIRRAPFCAVCGVSDRLQPHHIIPYRLTMDNRQRNLVPLCKRHHMEAEVEFRRRERAKDFDVAVLAVELIDTFDRIQAATRFRLQRQKDGINDPRGNEARVCDAPDSRLDRLCA